MGKIKDKPEVFCGARKYRRAFLKSQIERSQPCGKSCNNFSHKVNIVLDYNLKNKINMYEPMLHK